MASTSSSDILDKQETRTFLYNEFHSLVLLCLGDAEYMFIWYDIVAAGSSSDAYIIQYTDLRHKIENNTFGHWLPTAESLVDNGPKIHSIIIAVDAFPLRIWML